MIDALLDAAAPALRHLLGAGLVWALACLGQRALQLSHADRSYWLGAALLAALSLPLALLTEAWLPVSVSVVIPFAPADWEAAAPVVAAALPADAAPLPIATLLLTLYLTGLGALLLRRLRGEWRLHRLIGSATAVALDVHRHPASARLLRALARKRIEVGQVALAVSPFAVAWPRRRILLPASLLGRLSDAQLCLVLRHEIAHLRHRDPAWAALLSVLVSLFWFDPWLRALARRARLASELACDRAAVATRKTMRRAYAEAYLETLRMSLERALPCPASAFSPQDQGHHTMRIRHILHGDPSRRKPRWMHAGLALLGLSISAGLGTVQASAAITEGTVRFSGPIIEGRISSPFGVGRPQLSREPHKGIDLTAARGTPVRAPAAGLVIHAESPFAAAPNYGTVVVLDHGDGWHTLYAHLDRFDVKTGQRVAAGDTLGSVGSSGKATGPHVHVEVLHHGVRVDPAEVIKQPVGASGVVVAR